MDNSTEPYQPDQEKQQQLPASANQIRDIDMIGDDAENDKAQRLQLEKRLRLKVDLRLCSIAGLLCSLNLLDSGIISSASVTSMFTDL
jgi:transcription elongation GreA/GreB family factor